MYSIYLLISDLVLRPDGRTDVKRHKFSRVEHFKLGHYPPWGVLVFPRVLVQLVRLKGSTHHHRGECCGVQPDLDALPSGVKRLARPSQLACEASRRAPPWPSLAAAAPGALEADGSLRRRYRIARCNSPRTPDTGMPESGPGHGRVGDLGSRSAGIASPLGGGGVPARGSSGHRRASRLWESRSYHHITTRCTVATHEPNFLSSSRHIQR